MMADSESERQRKVKAGREKLLQFQQRKKRKKEGKNSASPTPSEASVSESHSNNNNHDISHADLRDVSKATDDALSMLSAESSSHITTDRYGDDTDNDLPSLASNASDMVSQNGDSVSEYTSGDESYSYSTDDGNADSLAIAHLELNEYKEKVIGLEESLRGKQEALKEVNKENFELRAKLQQFETSKRQDITSSPVLKREIDDLHNALRNKQRVLEDMNVENHDLRSRLANKGNDEEVTPAQLEELRFNLASKQTTLRELNRQNEGLLTEIEKLKSEIEEQSDNQKQSGYEVNRIKALLGERNKDIDHLKSVITENTLSLDRLTTEKEALVIRNEELQSLLNESAAENRGLKRANESLLHDKNTLDEQLSSSFTKIKELEETVKTDFDWNDTNDETQRLQDELNNKNQRINDLEYQVSMAVGERDALHLEAQTEAEEFREQIENLQRQIEEDNQMLACHEESIDKASKDLSASVEQVLELQQSLKTERDNVVRLEVELLQIKEHCEERIQNMKDSYNTDHFEKVNCVEAKDAEIDELNNKYNTCFDELQNTRDNNDKQIALLEKEIERARKEADEQLAEVELVYSKKIADMESDSLKNAELEKEAAHLQLNHAIHDLKERHHEDVKQLQQVVNEKIKDLSDSQQLLDTQKETCYALEQELAALHNQSRLHEIEVNEYANNFIPQLQNNIDGLKAEVELLKQECHDSHESRKIAMNNLQQSHKVMLTGLESIKKEKDTLKIQLKQHLVGIHKEYTTKVNEWSTFALPLFSHNKETIVSCENELRKFKQDCLDFKTEMEALQLERNEIQSQLDVKCLNFRTEMEALQLEHNEIQSQLDVKSKDLENVKEQYESLLTVINRSSTPSTAPSPASSMLLSPNDDSIVDSDTSLVKDLKGQLEHVKLSHQKQMEQLQADFESDLKFLEEENERLSGELITIREQYEKEKVLIVDKKTKECEELLERFRSESSVMLDEREKAFEDQMEKLKIDYEEKLAQLQEFNNSKLEKLKQDHSNGQDNMIQELKETMLLEKRNEIEEITTRLRQEQESAVGRLKQQNETDLHAVRLEKQHELAALRESLDKSQEGDAADSNEVLICELKSLQMKYEQGEELLRQKEQELMVCAANRKTDIERINQVKEVAMEAIKRCLASESISSEIASQQKINDLITNEQSSDDSTSTLMQVINILESEIKSRSSELAISKQANTDLEQHINQLQMDNSALSDTVSYLKTELDNNFILQGDTTQEKAALEKALNELLTEKITLEEKLKDTEINLNESISKIRELETQKEDSVDRAVMNEEVIQMSAMGTESAPFEREEIDGDAPHQGQNEEGNVEIQLKHMGDLLLEHNKKEEELKNEVKQLQGRIEQEHAMFKQQIEQANNQRQLLESQLAEVTSCRDGDILKATEEMQERLVDAIREEEAVLAENKRLLALIEQNSVEAIKEKSMLQVQIMKQEETIQKLRDKVLTGNVVTSDLQDLFSRQMAHLESQRDELLDRLDEQKSEHHNYASVINENSTLTSTHRREKHHLLDKLREKDKLERTLTRERSMLDDKMLQLQKLRQSLSHKEELEKELLFQRNSLQGELVNVENHLLAKEEQLFKEKSHLESELQSKDRNLAKWEEEFARREKLHSHRVNKLRQHYANQLESTRHELERTHEQSMRRLHSDLYNNAEKRIQSMEDILQLRHGSDISSIRVDYNDQVA